jgi:hypothetical protein
MTFYRQTPKLAAAALTALYLILLSAVPARADDLPRLHKVGLTAAEEAKGSAGVKEAKVGSAKSPGASSRSGIVMRCWNYGRLVYESSVSGFVASSQNSNVVTVPGNPQKQVLDMRSGLCVIE